MKPAIPLLSFLFQWAVPYPINYEVLLQILNLSFFVIIFLTIPKLLSEISIVINPFYSFITLIPIFWNYIMINGFIDGAGLYYPYDVPSMAFFSLGLLLFLRKNWVIFYFIFSLALLNRESSCFISIAGFLLSIKCFSVHSPNWWLQNRKLLIHIFVQAIMWLSSRIILSYVFKNNPGSFFENPHSMIEFLNCIITDESHWAMESPIWFLTLFGGIWLLPIIYFKHLNSFSRKLLIVGCIYLLTLMLRSNMMETRVYNELNIVISVTVISVISSFMNRRPSQIKNSIIQ